MNAKPHDVTSRFERIFPATKEETLGAASTEATASSRKAFEEGQEDPISIERVTLATSARSLLAEIGSPYLPSYDTALGYSASFLNLIWVRLEDSCDQSVPNDPEAGPAVIFIYSEEAAFVIEKAFHDYLLYTCSYCPPFSLKDLRTDGGGPASNDEVLRFVLDKCVDVDFEVIAWATPFATKWSYHATEVCKAAGLRLDCVGGDFEVVEDTRPPADTNTHLSMHPYPGPDSGSPTEPFASFSEDDRDALYGFTGLIAEDTPPVSPGPHSGPVRESCRIHFDHLLDDAETLLWAEESRFYPQANRSLHYVPNDFDDSDCLENRLYAALYDSELYRIGTTEDGERFLEFPNGRLPVDIIEEEMYLFFTRACGYVPPRTVDAAVNEHTLSEGGIEGVFRAVLATANDPDAEELAWTMPFDTPWASAARDVIGQLEWRLYVDNLRGFAISNGKETVYRSDLPPAD